MKPGDQLNQVSCIFSRQWPKDFPTKGGNLVNELNFILYWSAVKYHTYYKVETTNIFHGENDAQSRILMLLNDKSECYYPLDINMIFGASPAIWV